MGEPTNGGCDDAQNARPRDSNKVKARERCKMGNYTKVFHAFPAGSRRWGAAWSRMERVFDMDSMHQPVSYIFSSRDAHLSVQ